MVVCKFYPRKFVFISLLLILRVNNTFIRNVWRKLLDISICFKTGGELTLMNKDRPKKESLQKDRRVWAPWIVHQVKKVPKTANISPVLVKNGNPGTSKHPLYVVLCQDSSNEDLGPAIEVPVEDYVVWLVMVRWPQSDRGFVVARGGEKAAGKSNHLPRIIITREQTCVTSPCWCQDTWAGCNLQGTAVT